MLFLVAVMTHCGQKQLMGEIQLFWPIILEGWCIMVKRHDGRELRDHTSVALLFFFLLATLCEFFSCLLTISSLAQLLLS